MCHKHQSQMERDLKNLHLSDDITVTVDWFSGLGLPRRGWSGQLPLAVRRGIYESQ